MVNYTISYSVITCLAKYGHLSSVIVVKLDGFVLPALNRSWDIIPVKNLFEEGPLPGDETSANKGGGVTSLP